MRFRKIAFLFFVLSLFTISACGKVSNNDDYENKTTINVGLLKGPTGIGAVKLIDDYENGRTKNEYNFVIASSPDELNAKIINGEVDVATVPTNVASVLYNKMQGGIKLCALNTLGVLYIVENSDGDYIKSINDIEGKKIVASGKGAVPEYVLNYILHKNDVKNVSVEYKSQHAEVMTAIESGEAQIALLPEPNVTILTSKNENVKAVIDITEEWNKVSNGSTLSMGGLIARDDFINKNKEAFDEFLLEYKNSINFVNENIDESSKLVEKYGIVLNSEIAKKSIPNCNIIYTDGESVKKNISGFYDILYDYEPKSIGGKIPDDEFYYIP